MIVSLKINFVQANSADPDEMPHQFIWVYTVCQSTHKGVPASSSTQLSQDGPLYILGGGGGGGGHILRFFPQRSILKCCIVSVKGFSGLKWLKKSGTKENQHLYTDSW